MNAFNTINLAGAVVLTSTDVAKELGVPQDRWIYPLGGAGSSDADQCKLSLFSKLARRGELMHKCSLGETKLLQCSSNLKIDRCRTGHVRANEK
jgi:hypothetical protein